MWFLVVVLILIIWGVIYRIVEARRQGLRDKAARLVLSGYDLRNESEEIRNVVPNARVAVEKEQIAPVEVPVEIAQKAAQQKCPIDGGLLVVRFGKYGQFWGCANYPRCTYTTNSI